MANVDILLCHIAPKLLDVINSIIIETFSNTFPLVNQIRNVDTNQLTTLPASAYFSTDTKAG